MDLDESARENSRSNVVSSLSEMVLFGIPGSFLNYNVDGGVKGRRGKERCPSKPPSPPYICTWSNFFLFFPLAKMLSGNYDTNRKEQNKKVIIPSYSNIQIMGIKSPPLVLGAALDGRFCCYGSGTSLRSGEDKVGTAVSHTALGLRDYH